MPTYDYKCDKCGHSFEKFQSFSEDFLKVCPECGDETLRKVFSPSGIVFKGSGWYINDSRSKSGSKETKSEDSSNSNSTSESAA